MLRVISRRKLRRDFRTELIRAHVRGKSFVDVGCMWGIHGFYCFQAEKYGATRSIGVDVYPASSKFLDTIEENCSMVEFIQGDINEDKVCQKIGKIDVVLSTGVLYHMPNLIQYLLSIQKICKEKFILGTMLIPEMGEIKNGAIFYPFLPEKDRELWNQKIGRQRAITSPYDATDGYGNWFWGLTPSCVEALLACAGFRVSTKYIEGSTGLFVCDVRGKPMEASSGPWTNPRNYQRSNPNDT